MSEARPEMETFRALGAARGWKVSDYTGDVHLEFDTSPTDAVDLNLTQDGDDLSLALFMWPEEELRSATPDEMASTLARWLRDAADAIERKAPRAPGAAS